MPRDIEANAVINDKSKAGLDSFERNVRQTGKNVQKEFDKFGKGLGDSLISSVGAISPRMAQRLSAAFGDSAKLGAPLLISGISASLPVLSGLIGAAVTGGAAGLGIIGGVALAARDARVQKAGKELGAKLLSGLTDRAGSFITPVLRSLDIVENAFNESGDTIKRIFTNSAKLVEPLASTLAGLGQDLIEGLDIAVSRAGPVMDSLNRGLAGTGEAIKSLLDDVTRNADGNAKVLDSTFKSLNYTIEGLGKALYGLSEVFSFLDSVMPLSLFETLENVLERVGVAGGNQSQWIEPTTEDLIRLGAQEQLTAKSTQAMEKALRDNARAAQEAASAQRSLFDDTTRVGQAMDDAKESVKKNGKTLDENTEKGRNNRNAISNLASAMNGYRTNLEKSGASAATVSKVMESQRGTLYRVALQMTGNKTKARELTNALLGVPKKTNTESKLNTQKAKQEARNYVNNSLGAIPRNVTTTVSVNVNTSRLNAVENRLQRLQNSGYYAAAGSWIGHAAGQMSRTAPATQVFATVENRVYLDGAPFRSFVDRRVQASEAKAAHKARYGGRH